ncbi:MAG: cysteine--tRNA ligase [Sutterellaceae bacterium]|nr:cysteine--tRNA ligase [Sutterellaceae bacterium]
MSLKIYSTLTKKIEEFQPLQAGKVGMYVCGVTVYDYTHIGHGRTFVAFDVIRRWLEASGLSVTFVRNVTDVDDKIIKRAAERNISTKELTDTYTLAMQQDMLALGCLAPTFEPRATEFIPQMLSLVEKLEEKGLAYADGNGDVDYAVRKFAGYGKLSGRTPDDMRAGARIEIAQAKRDPLDFVLWKAAKPGEPAWDSKWGQGRPGWHIECSAMSRHYLGETFDIHGGGPDLIFPHHENEIAQSEGANGKPFARYWMHSGPLRVRKDDGTEEKMSKSLGNFWTIRDALKETNERFGEGNGNEVLRFFLLRSHYRSPISFNPSLIEDAQKGLTRLYSTLKAVPAAEVAVDWTNAWCARFKDAMDDDFNTSLAVSVLFEMATEVNRTGEAALASQLKALGRIFNILQLDPETFLKGAVSDLDEAAIDAKVKARFEAKKAKDWATADAIRKELSAMGIVIEDGAEGSTWRRA